MMIFDVYYMAIKAMFFFGLVSALVKFENLQKQWLFIALLYAAGVAFLSWIWLVQTDRVSLQAWQTFCIETMVISLVYFRLITWFEDGVIFWTLLLLGMVVVWF